MLLSKIQEVIKLANEKKYGTNIGRINVNVDKNALKYYHSNSELFSVDRIYIYEPEFSDAEQIKSDRLQPSKRRFCMQIDERYHFIHPSFYFEMPFGALSKEYIENVIGFKKLTDVLSGEDFDELRKCGFTVEVNKKILKEEKIYKKWIGRNMNFDFEREFFNEIQKKIGGEFYNKLTSYSKELDLFINEIDGKFLSVQKQLINFNSGYEKEEKYDFLVDLLQYFKEKFKKPVMQLDVNIKGRVKLEQIEGEITGCGMEITDIPHRENMKPHEAFVGFSVHFNPETLELLYNPFGSHEVLNEINPIFV